MVDTNNTTTRRDVLKKVAGGTAGLTVASGATGTAAAGSKGDCDPDGNIARIDTTDYLDTTWYGSVYHVDDADTDEYDRDGEEFPDNPEELLVQIHGWSNNETCGHGHIETVADVFEDVGYEHTVTGLTWGSDYAWWNAKEIGERNAPKLAAFLREFADENPETTIRLKSHSLGARVLAETLLELYESDDEDDNDLVTSATFLAGAIDAGSVAMDGDYGEALENAAEQVDNFRMDGDAVLDWAYETYEWDPAVGEIGCDGEQPENYTDHEVTVDVGHLGIYENETVMGNVLDTFE
jgi:esterase/lipase superfamily enzyme